MNDKKIIKIKQKIQALEKKKDKCSTFYDETLCIVRLNQMIQKEKNKIKALQKKNITRESTMIDPITQYLLEQDEDHHAWYEKEGGKVEKEIYNWLIHEFLELNRKATASCEQAGYSGSKLRKCYIKSSSKVYSKWSSWANTVGKNKCKGMSKNNAKIMSMCMNGMKKAKVRAKAISKQYK